MPKYLCLQRNLPGGDASTDNASPAQMQAMYEKYGKRGVQPVAVCLSQDLGAAATFARGERLDYPVVTDWGTHNSDNVQEMSPVATASPLPSLAPAFAERSEGMGRTEHCAN